MKKINAIIRPEKLELIKDVLKNANVNGITVSQVMGCGNQRGWTEQYRGNEVIINFIPKVQIEIVTEDNRAEEIVNLIIDNARTGEVGDGKIFITDVKDCIRIRTGEKGSSAI